MAIASRRERAYLTVEVNSELDKTWEPSQSKHSTSRSSSYTWKRPPEPHSRVTSATSCHRPMPLRRVFEGGDIAKFFGDMSKKLYFGHFSYADCARFGANGHYITILRSPLRRAFSQYSSWHNPKNLTPFWRKTLLKREIEAVEAVQRMSFQDFVMSDDIYVNGHIRNLMSKRLAHDSSWSDSSLGTAFEVLECKFYWFGVVEEFERSIELFRASFTGCDRLSSADRSSQRFRNVR